MNRTADTCDSLKPLPSHNMVTCENAVCADCAEIATAFREDMGSNDE